MAYNDTDLGEVLTAIVARIVAQSATTGFSADTCYLAPSQQSARLVAPNPGQFFCAVAAGDGNFDEELWDGGGTSQTCLDMTVSVTMYTTVMQDQPGRNKAALTSATYGLSAKVKAMLKVLSAFALLDPGGVEVLRIRPRPAGMHIPDLGANIHAITLDFALGFDWDLS